MAEASAADTWKLNPESAEFVPQAKAKQPQSGRNYKKPDRSQDWRTHRARPHSYLQFSANNQDPGDFEPPASDAQPPPHAFRGGFRGGRGRGGRARAGRGRYDPRPQSEASPNPEREAMEIHTAAWSPSTGDENNEKPPVKMDRGSHQNRPGRGRAESLTQELHEHQCENQENRAARGSKRPDGGYEHLKNEQRNHVGWRGGDRRPLPPQKNRSGWNHGIEGNWRARDPVQDTSEEKSQATGGRHDEQKANAGGAKGKKAAQQNSEMRRGSGSERRTGPVKRMEPPNSKETQTGCLIEQLTEEKYECMVCCEAIRVMAPVWSCQSCHHVFHLNCIKKWARSPASQADDGSDGWRCPACQHVTLKAPSTYTCFCGKVTNPEFQRTEIPHSCGDMCGKKRSGVKCNHPCNILCHPGPCPQCPAFINKSCVCGKISKPVRCSQAEPVLCQVVCGGLLNCSEHCCAQVCHSGPCQPCRLRVQQVCFCGVVHREVPCGTDREHYDGSGYFSCSKLCGKMLDCQLHRCEQLCHPGQCHPCPLSPRLVRSCSCGQTPISKLLELGYPERKTCTDPIPSCGKTCNKPLPCGGPDSIHFCEKLCHEDACGPCALTSSVKCRCGSNTKEVACASIQNAEDSVFLCEKRCTKKRSCGRHKCGESCCVVGFQLLACGALTYRFNSIRGDNPFSICKHDKFVFSIEECP